MTPNHLLFGGEVFDGRDPEHPLIKLVDGRTLALRVRTLPARHLTTPGTGYLDLRDVGREADMLQLVLQRPASPDPASPWAPVDAEFVDLLSDESHRLLVAAADRLNLFRAVSQAERQLETGTQLLPLKQRLAEQMLAPTKAAFASWMSSLNTQLASALAAKQP